jgi:hypothetical protein
MATVEAKMRELVATWQASPEPYVLKDWLSTELEKLVEMLRNTVAERKNTAEQVEAALVKVEEQLCHEHMCLQKEHETTQPGALEKLEKKLRKTPVAERENASEQLEAERKRLDAELQKLERKRKQPDADERTQAQMPKKAAMDGPRDTPIHCHFGAACDPAAQG